MRYEIARCTVGRRLVPPVAAALVASLVLFSGAIAEGWCDLVFKDVVPTAQNVIVAGYHRSGKSDASVSVVEVLKGECTDEDLDMDLEELESYRLRDGDRLVVALTAYHQPIRVAEGMGGCTPVSILPIRGDKLRGRDRAHYDFRSKSMPFETLRSELIDLIASER